MEEGMTGLIRGGSGVIASAMMFAARVGIGRTCCP